MVGPREGHSRKKGMPMSVPSARYSLVKGERIVRSMLSTRHCSEWHGSVIFIAGVTGSAAKRDGIIGSEQGAQVFPKLFV